MTKSIRILLRENYLRVDMKRGTSLEKGVQQVYTYLLNMRDEGVVVGNSIFMTGKSGVQHEIDVYYEFSKAGIRHRVAIECKDWATQVSKGQIQEFESKLRDIGNITGVMIARRGYQSGAETFARHMDIIPLVFDDLPSFNILLGQHLTAVALPNEDYIGEPFWMIMEICDGRVTGSHYSREDKTSGKRLIPMMFSQFHAEQVFHEAGLDPQKWAVRGLLRFALHAFLISLEVYEKKMNAGAQLVFRSPGNARFIGLQVSREQFIREYFGENIPSVEDIFNRHTINSHK
jgi:hypothetical protein